MTEQFPMGYGAFPPYGFGMPGQTGMYMPSAPTSVPMNPVMPTPAFNAAPVPKKKSAAKKSTKGTTPKKTAKKPKAKKPKAKKPKKKTPKKKAPKKKAPKKKAAKAPKPKLTKSGKKKKERDPLAPKRARTAFNFFLDAFREEYKITHPDIKGVVHCTKAGSEKWKTLTPTERAPYEEKAAAAREAYLKAKEEYLASGGPQKFKLAKGPPRPPTAYFIFLTNFRKEKNNDGSGEKTSIKDISKLAGQKWREMDPTDKVPYEQKAALAKEEYLKLKALTAEERLAKVGIVNPYSKYL